LNIGGYEILRKLGEGAFGKVYLARKDADSGFRAYYALKRLRVEHAPGSDVEEYLHREARLGGLVNHPSLVRIHEVLRHRGEIALVMDYVDGITLRRILRRRHGLELPRDVVLEVGAGVLEALHYIHTLTDPEGNAQGFIHRDVKPGNVMLTRQGQLKVMDFGVARLEDEARTVAGELRGTIAYMAPEQARGEPVGPATDQFATGLLILEMATGRRAWGDGKATGVLARVVAGDVSQAMLRLDATDPLAPILMRMLQPEPGERYPDAAAAAHALRVQRAQLGTPPALAEFAAAEIDGLSSLDTLGPEGVPSWTGDNTGGPGAAGVSDSWHGISVESEPPPSVSLTPGVVQDDGSADPEILPDVPEVFPDDIELDAPVETTPTPALLLTEEELEARLGEADPARTLPLGIGMGIPDIDLGDPEQGEPEAVPAEVEIVDEDEIPADATLPLPATAPAGALVPVARPTSPPVLHVPAGPPARHPRAPAPPPMPGPSATTRRAPGPRPRRRKKAPPPAESMFSSKWVTGVVAILLVGALIATTRAVLTSDVVGVVPDDPDPDIVAVPSVTAPGALEFDLDSAAAATPQETPDAVADETPDEASEETPDETAPEAQPTPPDAGREPVEVVARIEPTPERDMFSDAAPEPTPKRLAEGDIIGRKPVEELGEYRRVGRDRGVDPTPEPEERIGAALKLVSAREQPLGADLDLRVRPDGFDADRVSVYYQWRSEGASGRRKRTLRGAGGDFTLSLPARELKQDRLQVWFVAEPGDVRLGSANRPIEVRVR